MTLFLILAALMLVAALAVVLRPLLSKHAPVDAAAAARRRMHALNEAHAAGVLTDQEFAAKRAELGDSLLTAIDAAPAPKSRTTFAAAVAVALLLPAAALVLYRVVGDPRALDPAALTAAAPEAPGGHGADMDQAIAGLATKLKQNPDDAEGWALLGRAYLETQHFAEARDALKHAHDLVPNDADVTVAYAEAVTLASDSHQIDAETRALIESALKADPKNQRGTWLLGIADYQAGKYDAAIASWNRLLEDLPKDSSVAQSVKDQIARAEAERDGREPPAPAMASSAGSTASSGSASPAPSGATGAAPRSTASAANASPAPAPGNATAAATAAPTGADGGPHLTVKVTLDPSLTSKVAPGDTVFVYAKAASGPPMPLAIQRLRADQLPATVVLTDGMGMMPSMKLSQFPQVIIGARVSKSGNAIAQSGDLQTISKPLDVASTAPINLTIDQAVP